MSYSDRLYLLGAIWSAAGFVIYAVPGTKFAHLVIAAGGGMIVTIAGSFVP